MITNKYDLMNVKKDFMNGKSPLPTNFLDLGVKMAQNASKIELLKKEFKKKNIPIPDNIEKLDASQVYNDLKDFSNYGLTNSKSFENSPMSLSRHNYNIQSKQVLESSGNLHYYINTERS